MSGSSIKNIAGLYWDSNNRGVLGGIPEDGAKLLRQKYVSAVLRSAVAMAEIEAWWADESSTVTITLKEYKRLERRGRKLAALERGGVDNWQWYEDSLREFWESEDGAEDD